MRTWLWSVSLAASLLAGGWLAFYALSGGESDSSDRTAAADLNKSANDDPFGYKTLPVEAESSKLIAAAAGGDIELQDGTKVEFPAGALRSDRTVTVKRLKYVGPGEPSIIIDVDAGEEDLAQEAVVTLPVPHDARIPTAAERLFIALHVHGGQKSMLPVEYDAARGVATVRTKRFSYIHLLLLLAAGYETMFAKGSEHSVVGDKLLAVPYYSQGDTQWCWATCTQMMQKHYGTDSEIWDFARLFQAPSDEGFSSQHVLTRYQTTLIEGSGLEVDASKLGFFTADGLTRYICAQVLEEGRPVWVALPGIQHVVVVVGMDYDGLFIHDPSGEVIDLVHQKRTGAKMGEMLVTRLSNAHIAWNDWLDVVEDFSEWKDKDAAWYERGMKRGGEALSPVGHTMVVLGGEERRADGLTLAVANRDIVFHHPQHPGPGGATAKFENVFELDGTAENGHRFSGMSPALQGLLFNDPTNFDRLQRFTVTLHNSSSQPVRGACVRLLLDGREIRSQSGIEVPANTTNVRVEMMEGGPLDFCSDPLTPGLHKLHVSVDSGGKPCDSARILFQMGPLPPEGLRAAADGGVVRLAWNPNPEENITYVLWRDGKLFDSTQATSFDAQDDGREHAWQVEAVYDASRQFGSLHSIDPKSSELQAWPNSYLSERVSARPSEEPPKPATSGGKGLRLVKIHASRSYDGSYAEWFQPENEVVPLDARTFELKASGDRRAFSAVLNVSAPSHVASRDESFDVSATAQVTWTREFEAPVTSGEFFAMLTVWGDREVPGKDSLEMELDEFTARDTLVASPEKPFQSGAHQISLSKSESGTLQGLSGRSVRLIAGSNCLWVTFVYEEVQ